MISDFSNLIRDSEGFVEITKERYPNLPIFLLGESMGGAISVILALKRPELYRGLILLAPALGFQ